MRPLLVLVLMLALVAWTPSVAAEYQASCVHVNRGWPPGVTVTPAHCVPVRLQEWVETVRCHLEPDCD